MKMKFYGTPENLVRYVDACGREGFWSYHSGNRFYRFLTISGEILDWWPNTGTLSFRGKPGPLKHRLHAELSRSTQPVVMPLNAGSTRTLATMRSKAQPRSRDRRLSNPG
ncbi:hypothetical protein [Methylobacterium sp. WL116]|uniref:hypothetical protein n=1 Tax=Methylobacterium sp. WL116 TaxID=2603889 RepID=UPI0011D8B5CB|nr:hypothetical protein [Methylobacterium sp. WL116]TXM92612.1 hypothetical protein FV223_11215 [Methylobacterium sp. WL116]